MSWWISTPADARPRPTLLGLASRRTQGRKQHDSISSAASQQRQTPRRDLFLRYCRRGSLSPELFLQGRSARRVDKVRCGYGCQLAVGSRRLSPPKYVIDDAGVSNKKNHTTHQHCRGVRNFHQNILMMSIFSNKAHVSLHVR